MGLFTEMGPCTLDPNSTHTTPNPHSWNNNASVLFIDQPAGTGLSPIAADRPLPDTDIEGAVDFQVFLNVFFRDIFQDLAHLPIHIAAESYGGHYAPVYTHHIIDSRAYNSRDAFWGNITSLILVNALVDRAATFEGTYELLCSPHIRGSILNDTACDSIAAALPECTRLGELCQLTEDGEVCEASWEYCIRTVGQPYEDERLAGRRSPFNSKSGSPGRFGVREHGDES